VAIPDLEKSLGLEPGATAETRELRVEVTVAVVVLRTVSIFGAGVVEPRGLIVRFIVASEKFVRGFFHWPWPFGLAHDDPIVRIPNHTCPGRGAIHESRIYQTIAATIQTPAG
jgi:hypothetical protein